jgi:hypothetical protein
MKLSNKSPGTGKRKLAAGASSHREEGEKSKLWLTQAE